MVEPQKYPAGNEQDSNATSEIPLLSLVCSFYFAGGGGVGGWEEGGGACRDEKAEPCFGGVCQPRGTVKFYFMNGL